MINKILRNPWKRFKNRNFVKGMISTDAKTVCGLARVKEEYIDGIVNNSSE